VTTSPMMDFQIKDLIGRRSRPLLHAEVNTRNMDVTADLHRYALNVRVDNIGSVTVEKWWMEVDLPMQVVRDTRSREMDIMRSSPRFSSYVQPVLVGGIQFMRVAFGDPTADGASRTLHPGQTMSFDGSYPTVVIEIDSNIWGDLQRYSPGVRWRVFLPNSSPLEGTVAFDRWCRF
jgi:hypothetical protein